LALGFVLMTFLSNIESQGCQEAGSIIFSDPVLKAIVETYFVPAAFNTWDRHNSPSHMYGRAFAHWSGRLKDS
jgi:hypothetical protein